MWSSQSGLLHPPWPRGHMATHCAQSRAAGAGLARDRSGGNLLAVVKHQQPIKYLLGEKLPLGCQFLNCLVDTAQKTCQRVLSRNRRTSPKKVQITLAKALLGAHGCYGLGGGASSASVMGFPRNWFPHLCLALRLGSFQRQDRGNNSTRKHSW